MFVPLRMLHILQGEKMKGILEWVKQIACYMVLVTVLADLLPKKNYEKYFRLFAGLVLILLVIQPVTGPLKLDRQILKMFEGIQYEGMAGEFRQRASEMEEDPNRSHPRAKKELRRKSATLFLGAFRQKVNDSHNRRHPPHRADRVPYGEFSRAK